MRAVLHGRWELALYLNPLAFPALLAALCVLVVLVIEVVRGRRLCDWEALVVCRFAPVVLALCLAWWLPHIALALKTPKPELVDLRNPIAATIRTVLEPQAR
jgi:hypothetical protein